MIFHFNPDEQGRKKAIGIIESLGAWKHGYILDIKKNHPIRSNDQNAYYWVAIVKVICIHTGEDKDRVHNLIQLKCNYIERKLKNGVIIRQAKGTSKMDSAQFVKYCEQAIPAAKEEWPELIFPDEMLFNTYVEQAINEEYKNVFSR